MPYAVEFVASAAKEFRSLPIEIRQRVSAAIDVLCEEPRPPGVRKLRGHPDYYRIRIGAYRVVYQIDDTARLIRITRVRHRREAYR
jgi:mRNA interferase RelE/StbE